MNRIAQFKKVSFEQFKNDFITEFKEFEDKPSHTVLMKRIWDDINIPNRATTGSAGYDFVSPISFELKPNETIKIPTGIRCNMDTDWVLMIYPRSSIGFKYQVGLANTTGIIDSDYYNGDNEGHIMVKLVNHGDKVFSVNEGEKIVQGIFLQYGITVDDDANGERKGGLGSTGK